MVRSSFSAVLACLALYATWILAGDITRDYLSNRAWTLRPSLSVKTSFCVGIIGNLHFCRIEYEDSDTVDPLSGTFHVLYPGHYPHRISLQVSTLYPSHVSASFATDHVTARFGLLVMIASVAGLSIGIGILPSLVRMIRAARRESEATLVLVKTPAAPPKPLASSRHAGLRRLGKLGS